MIRQWPGPRPHKRGPERRPGVDVGSATAVLVEQEELVVVAVVVEIGNDREVERQGGNLTVLRNVGRPAYHEYVIDVPVE